MTQSFPPLPPPTPSVSPSLFEGGSPTSSHAAQKVRPHELPVLLDRSAKQEDDDAKNEEERKSVTRALREHRLQGIPDLCAGGSQREEREPGGGGRRRRECCRERRVVFLLEWNGPVPRLDRLTWGRSNTKKLFSNPATTTSSLFHSSHGVQHFRNHGCYRTQWA